MKCALHPTTYCVSYVPCTGSWRVAFTGTYRTFTTTSPVQACKEAGPIRAYYTGRTTATREAQWVSKTLHPGTSRVRTRLNHRPGLQVYDSVAFGHEQFQELDEREVQIFTRRPRKTLSPTPMTFKCSNLIIDGESMQRTQDDKIKHLTIPPEQNTFMSE